MSNQQRASGCAVCVKVDNYNNDRPIMTCTLHKINVRPADWCKSFSFGKLNVHPESEIKNG